MVNEGQTFESEDGVIRVTVIRAGSARQRARIRIDIVRADVRATYTIVLHKASGTDPDRLKYETDNWRNVDEHEFGCDPVTNIEVRKENVL